MKLSKKKILHAYNVYSTGLIDSMKKYKVIEELKDYGIEVNENSSIDGDTTRGIYKRLCENLCKRYEEVIKDEISKGNYRG